MIAAALLLAAAPAVIRIAERPRYTALSPDGTLLVMATKDAVRLYRVADGSVVREAIGDARPSAGAFFAQSDRWAEGRRDGTLRIVRLADGAELQSTRGPDAIDNIFVANDSKRLVFVTTDGRPFLWVIGSAPVPLPRPEIGGLEDAAFSADGKLVALAADETTITIADASDGHLVQRIDSLEMAPFAVRFAPDGKRLFAAGASRALMLFDVATWKETSRLPADAQTINDISISPDGTRVALRERPAEGGDGAGTIVVWNVRGAPAELLREPHALGMTARFVSSGAFVYTIMRDDGLHVVSVSLR